MPEISHYYVKTSNEKCDKLFWNLFQELPTDFANTILHKRESQEGDLSAPGSPPQTLESVATMASANIPEDMQIN